VTEVIKELMKPVWKSGRLTREVGEADGVGEGAGGGGRDGLREGRGNRCGKRQAARGKRQAVWGKRQAVEAGAGCVGGRRWGKWWVM